MIVNNNCTQLPPGSRQLFFIIRFELVRLRRQQGQAGHAAQSQQQNERGGG
jgi:hypothetical protein